MQLTSATLVIDSTSYPIDTRRATYTDLFFTTAQLTDVPGGKRLVIALHPKSPLTIEQFRVEWKVAADRPMLANGYQSRAASRWYQPGEHQRGLRWFARPFLQYTGDYHIPGVSYTRGQFHSWSHTAIRLEEGRMQFFGTLDESTAYTQWQYTPTTASLRLLKDLKGLALSHSFPLLDVCFTEGPDLACWQQYFDLMSISPTDAPSTTGWTSKHLPLSRLSKQSVLDHAAAFHKASLPLDHILIHDGWQAHVGDWLDVSHRFASGMVDLAGRLRSQGHAPGVWVAPFVCSRHSNLYRDHRDWLLTDPSGKPLKVGYRRSWGGWFYALDFYHQGVQDYLSGVFYTLRQQWGFQLFELDYLCAAAILPRAHKTRAQVMHDTMQFLRRQLGDAPMIANGVPTASAYGVADYCRISTDVHTRWTNPFSRFAGHQERASTLSSLRSALSRFALDSRAFYNTLDVIVLQSDGTRLTPEQQYTLLVTNALLGSLHLTSDNPGTYTPEQLSEYRLLYHLRQAKVRAVRELRPDVWQITYRLGESEQRALINLTSRSQMVEDYPLAAYETMLTAL